MTNDRHQSLLSSSRFFTTIIVWLVLLTAFSDGLRAQSAASKADNNPPAAARIPQENRQRPLAERAAAGEIPFAFVEERLRPATDKIRRLPPTALPGGESEAGQLRKIGVVRRLEAPLVLSRDAARYAVTGGRVFLLGVISEGAKSVRVRFEKTNLPKGARVFVFPTNEREEFYGPYEKKGPDENGAFWSPPIEGEGVAIEVFVPNGAELREDFFEITEVSHAFVGSRASPFSALPPGPCHNGVSSSYAETAKSVGHLRFMLPGGEFICTGTLLITTSNNLSPLLLSANHCFDTQSAAQSLRVYWNYNTGDSPPSGTAFTDGSNLLSTSPQTDFNFVRLTGSVPSGIGYAGWQAGTLAANAPIIGIHHPSGSFKRLSFGTISSTITGCPGGIPSACENFIRTVWHSGVTEGGSSGSGIFLDDASQMLIGTLWGGFSSCSNATAPDWYGRFSLTYHKISTYLSDAPCNYSVSPASRNFPAAGGAGSFTAATGSACFYSAIVTSPTTVQTFSNPTPINVADRASNSSPPGLGSLYPSTINVSGLSGAVTRVRVTLHGITHAFPDDLDFLLVAPNGQQVLLVSDAGGGGDLNNATITVDQSAQTLLSDDASPSSGAAYRPSNYAGSFAIDAGGADNLPFPGPGQNVFDNTLPFLNGISPNGAWRLYVADDEAQDVGAVSGGWSLELATTGGASWLTVAPGGSGYGGGAVNYSVAPNPPGQPARTGLITVGSQTHTVFQAGTTALRKPFDFDGDGRTDYGVFRPSGGVWYLQNSTSGFAAAQFGISTDKIAPADYDGDGKTDIAVFRSGIWYLLQSQLGFGAGQFGQAGDIPVPADYDGDGKADLAVFRPSNGTWYLLRSQLGFTGTQFGISTDNPVPADFDGDGKADLVVYRDGTWFLLRSQEGFGSFQFGIAGDKPVPADYDGDAKADYAVFRSGTWYLWRSQTGFGAVQFGLANDRPAAGDYDGDGKTDIAVWRPGNGTFYVLQSQAGFAGFQFGTNGDAPVASAYIP
jgi:subtilisin-like proprotein convertase family protein